MGTSCLSVLRIGSKMVSKQLQRSHILPNIMYVGMVIALTNIIIQSAISAEAWTIKRGYDEGIHKVYAREAKPYANLVYDKSLPFVPRYRYPVKQYYGKRSGGGLYDNSNPVYGIDGQDEWSPFQDAYSQDFGGLAKRPFAMNSKVGFN